jgi:hypothetical protein
MRNDWPMGFQSPMIHKNNEGGGEGWSPVGFMVCGKQSGRVSEMHRMFSQSVSFASWVDSALSSGGASGNASSACSLYD